MQSFTLIVSKKIKTLKFLPYIWTISQPVGLPAKHWRPRVKQRSPQESQPAQHRVHLASGAAALGWPRHKDGRRMHAQRSLLRDFSERQEGKCDRGAPRKRYNDQLKRQLAQVGISHQSWQQEASVRDSWNSSVRKASCVKAERHEAAKEKCRGQKERAASLSSSIQTFICPKCSMGCASRIGLYSHQAAYKNWQSTLKKILVCKEWAIIRSWSW